MLHRPQFQPHFRVVVRAPEQVYLLGERDDCLLTGRLYARIAPLLDGSRSVPEITGRLAGEASPDEVRYLLELLESKGYISDAPAGGAGADGGFWSTLGVPPGAAAGRLQETPVAIHAFGAVPVEPLADALASLGIRVAPEGGVSVVLADDYLHPDLEVWNREALSRETPWMLVKPTGTVLWFGPLFRPGRTGCWECLAQRLRWNRDLEAFLAREQDGVAPHALPAVALPTTLQAAAGMAATWIARAILTPDEGPLDGRLATLDLAAVRVESHPVVRRPQCPACGQVDELPRRQGPITLASGRKIPGVDGGFRICAAEETMSRLERQVSPITGVVRRFWRVPGVDGGVCHNYGADHHGPSRGDVRTLWQAFRSGSGGKGRTGVQAKAGALCEAIERYCGCYQGYEVSVRSTRSALGDDAIHPNACTLYSPAQYRNGGHRGTPELLSAWVPQPFDEAREVGWTPLWSLTEGRLRYLPTAFCYYDAPSSPDHRFCFADSNGCAAGNTLEESILQGFLELVERDAVAIWWYNRICRPAVDLSAFGDPYLEELRGYYRESLGRELWALDLTQDLGIPVFAAVSRRVDGPSEELLFGFGAHLDARLALIRAATELNQCLGFAARFHRGGQSAEDLGPVVSDWLQTATLAVQPYLAPQPGGRAATRADYPTPGGDDLRDDVLRCVEIARQRGLETLVLDQSRPDIELSVVKVVVPGLRHFWPRFAPGRLYDVPVRLGWLPAPLTEQELNPIPIFF